MMEAFRWKLVLSLKAVTSLKLENAVAEDAWAILHATH